jgi:tetratricopeptide (TPR) repeat protein
LQTQLNKAYHIILSSITLCVCLLATLQNTYAQPNLPPQEADSLFAVWNDNTQPDTNRLKAIDKIAWNGYLFTKPDSAFYFAQLQYNLAKEKGEKRQMGSALNTQGVSFYFQGDYDKAIDYYSKSLKIDEELGDKKGMAISLNNIGNIYEEQGGYNKAIDYYFKSLKIKEEIGDKEGMSVSYNNIGVVYQEQGDYNNAIDYFSKSLKIEEEIGNKKGIARSFNNIGLIYMQQGDYGNAINYYSKSLKIKEKIGEKKEMAVSLNNIGSIYNKQGDYDNAIAYYSKGLKIDEEVGNKKGMAISLNNIGSIYKEEGNYEQALDYNNRSLIIAQEVGAALATRDAANSLYQTHKKLGRHQDALQMYELFIETRDSLESEANQKAVIRQEYKYTYEKQAAADSVKNAEAAKVQNALLTAEQAEKKRLKSESNRQKLENKNQQQQAYFLYGILGLALLFGGFIFNRFKVTQKQKGIIESQKDEVEQQKEKVDQAYEQLEEKNTEILDSITYAKRIQEAILPPTRLVKEWLPNSFVLYKPKDIVAGDFYWMEHVGDTILFAAADCTGHGVPGAMVSVVCHNAMNRSVREFGLTDPGKILDKTNELVEDTFAKSDEEVKDGMDLALCSLKGNTLQYAGAHNPLWIIRKEKVKSEGESENNSPSLSPQAKGEAFTFTIIETKANKLPIGSFNEHQPYTTHTFELQPNDVFYIFSDGYVDQFGGKRGKKFKPKALRELLLSIQNQPMDQQRELINQAFEKWRGDLEQVDDVCIIGVKV